MEHLCEQCKNKKKADRIAAIPGMYDLAKDLVMDCGRRF